MQVTKATAGHSSPHIGHTIWLGDFNLHHSMWDEGRNSHLFTRENLDKSQLLIDMIAEFNLQMVLPKDILMLCTLTSGNYTRPDNVFISSSLTDTIIHCKTLPEECPARSNHIPITTHLNIRLTTQTEPPWPNFKATDWEEFRKELSARLERLENQDDIPNKALLLSHVDALMCAITETIEVCVPKCKLAPHQKHWWSQELMDRHWEVCRLAWRVYSRQM